MALQLVAASANWITSVNTDLPSGGSPLTMAAWAVADTTPAANAGIVRLYADLSGNDSQFLECESTTFQAGSIDQGVTVSTSGGSGAIGVGSYFHAAGVYSASNSRTGYHNAATGGTSTTTVNTSSLRVIYVSYGISGVPWNGRLASIAVWDAALTAAEIASLAKGFPPRRVRPQSLRYYVPAVRDVFEYRQGLTLTVNNGPLAVQTHPRQYGA